MERYAFQFCLTPFKSLWQEVFRTCLNLVKAIIWAHCENVQSSGIFKISTLCNILKIHELRTSNKFAKIIAQTKVRGVLKTNWQGLLNGVVDDMDDVDNIGDDDNIGYVDDIGYIEKAIDDINVMDDNNNVDGVDN